MTQPSVSVQTITEFMRLSTPNVSDALARLKIGGAPAGILPLFPCAKIVGAAATLKLVPPDQASESAVNGTLEAIVRGQRGGVLVIDNGGRLDVNSFGGVAGATAKQYGLIGCVTDGPARDVDEYQAYRLPVYGRGIVQQSIRGRSACAGYDLPVQLGGVRVRPKDLVMADVNGVVVVPQERIAEVLAVAQAVRATEDKVIADIRAGIHPVQAHEKVRYDTMLTAP